MALGEAHSQIPQANVARKGSIFDSAFMAELNQLSARETAASKNKLEVWMIREVHHHCANGLNIVGQPEVS